MAVYDSEGWSRSGPCTVCCVLLLTALVLAGLPSPAQSLDDGLPYPAMSLEDGLPSPAQNLEDGLPSPALSLEDGLPSPALSLEDGLPSPAQSLEDGLPSPTKRLEADTDAVTALDIIDVNDTTVVTSCISGLRWQNWTAQEVPPGRAQPVTLVLQLPADTLGQPLVCEWVIPRHDDSTSFVFQFHQTYSRDECQNPSSLPTVSMLDIDYLLSQKKESLHLHTIADSCSMAPGWKATAREGEDIIIRFNSSAVTETTVTIGSYSTFTSGYMSQCPDADRVANASLQTVEYPGPGLMIIGQESCYWSFSTPDEGSVLRLTLSIDRPEPGNDNHSCLNPDFVLEVRDFLGLNSIKYVDVYLCDLASGFEYVAVGDHVKVSELRKDITTMTPGIRLGYSAAPSNWTCPTSPLRLQADVTSSNFKGVNPLSVMDDAPRDCLWEISAPSPDMVVMIEAVTVGHGYMSSGCSSEDSVTLPGGRILALSRDDLVHNSEYQYRNLHWSANQTLLFRFSAASVCSGGNSFAVSYTAVSKNDCQGRPIVLTATEDLQTVVGKGPTDNGLYDAYDCRWLLRSESSDKVIQATVMGNTTHCPSYKGIQAHNGAFRTRFSSIRPQCPSNDGSNTKVFTSSGDTMLLDSYGSNRGAYQGDVTITYMIVDKKRVAPEESGPAGTAESKTASKLVLVTMSMAVLTLFNV